MKRILKGFGLAILILALSALLFMTYLLYPRPWATPGVDPSALWVANELDIFFVGFDEEKEGSVGQVVSNGEAIEVVMCWGPGNQFDILSYPTGGTDDRLVRGKCRFSENEGTVYVIEDVAGILGGVETITFVRQDNPNYHG